MADENEIETIDWDDHDVHPVPNQKRFDMHFQKIDVRPTDAALRSLVERIIETRDFDKYDRFDMRQDANFPHVWRVFLIKQDAPEY